MIEIILVFIPLSTGYNIHLSYKTKTALEMFLQIVVKGSQKENNPAGDV